MKSFIALSVAMASTAAAQRTMTVYNACPFTIWPALFTSAGTIPSQTTGWVADANTTLSFQVAEDWDGRIWGRRDCDFSTNPGPNSCLDGGCNGGLVCDVNTGTGVPPATLAEFNFNGGGNDWYDVSLVDGFNLPMRIDNNVGCGVPSCPVDLGPNCPAALQGPFNSSGGAVGCKSACYVDGLNGNAANSPNCCSGQYDTAATCPPSGVTDYSYFKDNCPDAYAYAYDESSGTALWSCTSSLNAAYTITFCP
ncbi:Thaumatin-like protein [Mycena sanguinolenta]|uniref:Thaumatin-like protein n=1 Tax=Mycena sanguinolenta TaxID=230812 RepID=A0A8H6Y472_9AGAR|nr:Thaumatin-like protein [Mycena sanguinolenta]